MTEYEIDCKLRQAAEKDGAAVSVLCLVLLVTFFVLFFRQASLNDRMSMVESKVEALEQAK